MAHINFIHLYLNADEFGKNDKIHFQMNAYNSHVDSLLRYDFTDEEPSDSFKATSTINPTSFWRSSISDDDEVISFTDKYYYDIKKTVSKKYLVVQYFEYKPVISGSYLEIINTYINWGRLLNSLIIIAVVLFFLIIGGCIFYHKYDQL